MVEHATEAVDQRNHLPERPPIEWQANQGWCLCKERQEGRDKITSFHTKNNHPRTVIIAVRG